MTLYPNFEEWRKAEHVTDAECMARLHLSLWQFQNRLIGRTPFQPLEKEVLAAWAGKDEEELFERSD